MVTDEIREALDNIAASLTAKEEWSDKAWTTHIKEEIAKLGQQMHYFVYGIANSPHAHDGEFVFYP